MRSTGLLIAILLLVLAALYVGRSLSARGTASTIQDPYPVSITGGCDIKDKKADPDTARPAKNQDIEWVMAENPSVVSFSIEQKGNGTFPWPSGTKFHGRQGAYETAVGPASKMIRNPNPGGRPHPYIVVFECKSGRLDILDPTIIIPPK